MNNTEYLSRLDGNDEDTAVEERTQHTESGVLPATSPDGPSNSFIERPATPRQAAGTTQHERKQETEVARQENLRDGGLPPQGP